MNIFIIAYDNKLLLIIVSVLKLFNNEKSYFSIDSNGCIMPSLSVVKSWIKVNTVLNSFSTSLDVVILGLINEAISGFDFFKTFSFIIVNTFGINSVTKFVSKTLLITFLYFVVSTDVKAAI